MNIIDKFAESLKNKPDITREAYDMWRDNEVTKRFMADVAEDLMGFYTMSIDGGPEYAVKIIHKREMAIHLLGGILEWQPLEEK